MQLQIFLQRTDIATSDGKQRGLLGATNWANEMQFQMLPHVQTSEYAGNIRAAEESQYEAAERPEGGRKSPERGSYRFPLYKETKS